MGYAKRLWEDEQGRRYSHTDKSVCDRCFDDYAIKAFIRGNASSRACSFCNRRNIRRNIAASGDAVLEFILEGIDSEYDDADTHALPYDDEEGTCMVPVYYIGEIVYEQHPSITSRDDVQSWITNSISDGPSWCEREPLVLSPAEGLVAGREDFCEAVKHKTRYLFFEPQQRVSGEFPEIGEEPYYVHPSHLLEELGGMVSGADFIRELPGGTQIFRARSHADGLELTTIEELGPPPVEVAKAGRMNAAGIVVFYGALDESTATAETVRGKPSISVGTFELTRAARILDLTTLPSIPSIFDLARRNERMPLRFLWRFCSDISVQIVPDDRIHVEYTPTQVVAEFIKERFRDREGNRVDGVLYPSSRRSEGRNIVLFVNRGNLEGISGDGYLEPPKILRLSSAKVIRISDLVRARAHQLYEQRGRNDGRALDDWLRAEGEILGEAASA
ncbi:MAG: HEPN-associated N-terminal domain-containing protein [Candidatus Angelobacter sp.]